jgi:cytochrome c oxidase assembly protein Cox11
MLLRYVDKAATNVLANSDIANRCGTTTITVIGVDFAVVPLYIHFKGIHEGNVKVAF